MGVDGEKLALELVITFTHKRGPVDLVDDLCSSMAPSFGPGAGISACTAKTILLS